MSLTLSGVRAARLTGGTGANNFGVGTWNGGGTLTGGGGSDTVTVTRDTSYSLSNALLTSTDGLNVSLSAIFEVHLGGGTGNNAFDVSGWTGPVVLTGGGGSDTVSATKD